MAVAITNRPKESDPEIRKIAALSLAQRIKDEHEEFADEDVGEMARDLQAVIGPHRDGYEVANDLERKGWSPDRMLVEMLDGGWDIRVAHSAAVKEWVKAIGIEPEFAVGDVVTFRGYTKTTRGYEETDLTGDITVVDRESAKYTVFLESEGHVRSGNGYHGRIVEFERVRRVE